MAVTFDEFVVLVKAMKAIYTDPKFIADADAMKMWYTMLKDLSYDELSMAIYAYIQTETFPPTVAGIRSKLQTMEKGTMTALEAWGIVRKAISRSSYYYLEEYEKLPKMIQKAVGSANNLREWAQVELGELETVIQSQFIRNYNAVEKRLNDEARLSPALQEKIRIYRQMKQELVKQPKQLLQEA